MTFGYIFNSVLSKAVDFKDGYIDRETLLLFIEKSIKELNNNFLLEECIINEDYEIRLTNMQILMVFASLLRPRGYSDITISEEFYKIVTGKYSFPNNVTLYENRGGPSIMRDGDSISYDKGGLCDQKFIKLKSHVKKLEEELKQSYYETLSLYTTLEDSLRNSKFLWD